MCIQSAALNSTTICSTNLRSSTISPGITPLTMLKQQTDNRRPHDDDADDNIRWTNYDYIGFLAFMPNEPIYSGSIKRQNDQAI